MGKPTGFKEIAREMPKRRAVELRVLDWNEIYLDMADKRLRDQGARCGGVAAGHMFGHDGDTFGDRLTGERLFVGCGDGSKHLFGPGDARLVEDTTGKGHTTRQIGPEPCVTATIPLANQ